MKIKRTVQIVIAIIILCTYSLVQAKECKHTFNPTDPNPFIYSENEIKTLRFMRIGFHISSDSITEIYKIELNGTRKQFDKMDIDHRWMGWDGIVYYYKNGTWNGVEYRPVKYAREAMFDRELWRKAVKTNEMPIQFPPDLLKRVLNITVHSGDLIRIDILASTTYCDALELYDYLINN